MYGLVLEGGGGKGAYQIGACKALDELGIGFACVAGTSIGALNGALLVQGDLKKAYDLWYDITPSKIINFSDEEVKELNEMLEKGNYFNSGVQKLKKIIQDRGLDIEPLVKTIKNIIDEDKIRKSAIDFGIVTVDLTNRKAIEIYKEDIPQGKLIDYLIASASIPGFKTNRIDGKVFIDGGFYNTLPINLVRDKGYKDIIVIRTYSLGITRRMDMSGLNLIYIAPVESLGPILYFSNKTVRKNLKMGYYDALKVFKKLEGRKYYISPVNDENFFLKYILNLSEEKIRWLCELFGTEHYSGKRIVFEYIIPRIAHMLGTRKNASYEDIAIGLIENIAELYGVERFKIYNIKELFNEISAKRHMPEKEHFTRNIPGLFRGNDQVLKMTKNEIFGIIANQLF